MAFASTTKSTYVSLRIDNETFAEIQAILAKSVTHTKEEPYTLSSWIKKAIADKLAHNQRGRRRKIKRSAKPDEEIEIPNPGECYATNQVA